MSCLFPTYSPLGYAIPCGKCKECRARLARHWSFRLQCEQRVNKYTFFCTFTYDDEHLPVRTALVSDNFEILDSIHYSKRYYNMPDGSVKPLRVCFRECLERSKGSDILRYFCNDHDVAVVNKDDCINYFRSLRSSLRSTGVSFKYFLCSEYGSTFQRPHYHALLFFNNGKLEDLIKLIKAKWIYGLSDVTLANSSACINYTNKYMRKVNNTPFGAIKPFRVMSKHIGESWVLNNKKFFQQLGSDDLYVTFDNGAKTSIPRYYRKKLGLEISGLYSDLQVKKQRVEDFNMSYQKALSCGYKGTKADFLQQYRTLQSSVLINESSKTPLVSSFETDNQ